MGASIDVTPCAKGSVASQVVVNAFGIVQGLSQLVNLPKPPTEAIRTLLSSVQFERTAHSEPSARKRIDILRRAGKRKENKGGENKKYKCEFCSRAYTYKSNLLRHVRNDHPAKRKKNLHIEVFECEECDFVGSSQKELKSHLESHGASTETTKSRRYKCAFCNKSLASIYYHYASKHSIEYPEQIMFISGNVLVHSSINPDGGKAPWFLREKEKMSRYTDVTCRLCEAETRFDNKDKLWDHYLKDHSVDPEMADNLNCVFRVEKGAHLIDLPASHTLKRRQSNILTLVKQKVSRMEENGHSSKVDPKNTFGYQVGKKPESSNASDNKKRDQTVSKSDTNPKLDKAKCAKYKCCFCNKDVAGIYKHYGNVHKIEYPEEILFEYGNALLRTGIDTGGGQAQWFTKQREEAENKYSSCVCRLCDADFSGTDVSLEDHYIRLHKIDQNVLKSLNNLRCLFRAEKGSHLVDMPTSGPTRRVSTQAKSRPVNSKRDSGVNEENNKANDNEQDMAGLIIYQCAECGVAATTCDASIEHAQLHHFAEYKPIPQTCGICKFSFEAQCFADHSSNHLNNNEYRTVKFDPSKLLDKWSVMFQGLSENHADRIKSSSTYQHTRRVKMNSSSGSGIPLYQCARCGLHVRPKDVEGHCFNYNCSENQAPGHFCSDCDIYFYTSAALTEHEKDHKKYDDIFFRTVTFNCKEDRPINRALQNLQNNSSPLKQASRGKASGSEKPQTNRGVQILEDKVVSVFCGECKQWVYSDIENHKAPHKYENVEVNKYNTQCGEEVQKLDKVTQQRNSVESNDKENHNSVENLPLTDAPKTSNVEGTVELWNSDNDSCNSLLLPVSSIVVPVEIHVEKECKDDTQNENDAHNIQNTANPNIFDEFSEEMANDLKRDVQHLGLELFGMTYIPDENLDNKDLLEPKTEVTEPIEINNNDSSQNEDKNIVEKENTLVNATESNIKSKVKDTIDIIEINDDSDDEIVFGSNGNSKPASRLSSRAILSRMLSSQE